MMSVLDAFDAFMALQKSTVTEHKMRTRWGGVTTRHAHERTPRKPRDHTEHHQAGGAFLKPEKNLGAVAQNHGGAFDHVKDEVHAANERIVHKALRTASSHEHLRKLHDALGSHATGVALDGLHGGHLRSMLRTIDPHHQHDGSEPAMRARLHDLASGAATPAAAGTKRRRSRAPAAVPETDEFSRSMGAKPTRPGGDD